MNKGDNIFIHRSKLQEIIDQLFSIEKKNLDLYFITTLLESLPKSYCTLVVLLETQPPIELILSIVTTQLLQQRSYNKNVESTFKAVLVLEKKSKSHFHIYTHVGSLHDYKKDAKYRYCSKKDYYKKVY